MKRMEIILLAAVAVLLAWMVSTRDSVAQAPSVLPPQQVAGRYVISMVPCMDGSTRGYYAILLDTETGRTWSSSNSGSSTIAPFKPLRGPANEREQPAEK